MMYRKLFNIFTILALLAGLLTVAPAKASPLPPDKIIERSTGDIEVPLSVHPSQRPASVKPIDVPNTQDYWRNQERMRLLNAGQTAEAESLALTGTDRALILLIEFPGTDVMTWTAGHSTWDPYGIPDPAEATGIAGDCSLIITETTVFTKTGPLHNEIPLPDRATIYTEDYSHDWYNAFLFGDGVVVSYTTASGVPVVTDFTGKSLQDFYLDMSAGQYTVTGEVVGWLPLDHSIWWYGADECPGAISAIYAGQARTEYQGQYWWDERIEIDQRHAVMDALDKVNELYPDFDWAQYDLDGDGVIDRLFVVHAGYGEEETSSLWEVPSYGEATFWSHSWSLPSNYTVSEGVFARSYIMMPENGGIGVFAHEFGHNLGAGDLYSYSGGETSAGFWTTMADDWTGHPSGFQPPAMDPLHLDEWGWLDPLVVTDTSKVHEVVIGQTSDFPGGEGMVRGVKIPLADYAVDLPWIPWQGSHYYWSGQGDLANGWMETVNLIAVPTGTVTATLEFDMVWDIEYEWDFLWVMASTNGTDWDFLTGPDMVCTQVSGWIGADYGIPDGTCGYSAWNTSWPAPDHQVIDLSAYAGQSIDIAFWFMTDWGTTYYGAYIDGIEVIADGVTLFTADAEETTPKWTFDAPFVLSPGYTMYPHAFYIQWRNVNPNGGYDSALGDARWWAGPTNTGMLVWYNNGAYGDNELPNYLLDFPSWGPKGRMLVVDSHSYPYRVPEMVAMGFDNEGGNVNHRSLMRDATFTLAETVDFQMRSGGVFTPTWFSGRPAVSTFHDALGYYPGSEFVSRGPGFVPPSMKWVTAQWDASVVMPATEAYPLRAPGYTADEEFRWDCTAYTSGTNVGKLGCYWYGAATGLGYDGGNGNPADVDGQFGWHAELIEEAGDHTWGKVRIWNSMYAVDANISLQTTVETPTVGDIINYEVDLQNTGSTLTGFKMACVSFPPAYFDYVDGSASGDALLLASCPSDVAAAQLTEAEIRSMAVTAGDVGGILWLVPDLVPGEFAPTYSFSLEVIAPYLIDAGDLDVHFYVPGGELYVSLSTPFQAVMTLSRAIFLPFMSILP